MKSFSNKSEKAAFWLSKYFKVILHQLESENYAEASDCLDWLNNKIINLFKGNNWKVIIDPRGKYNITPDVNISELDLNDIIIPASIEKAKEEEKIPEYRLSTYGSNSTDNEFLDALINGVYNTYHSSLGRDENIGHISVYLLTNVFIQLNNLSIESVVFDKHRFMSEDLIIRIHNRNFQILAGVTSSNSWQQTLAFKTGVQLYLNLLRKDALQPDLVPILSNALYDSLRLAVSNEKHEFFRWFVQSLVDGGYTASTFLYDISKLRSVILNTTHEAGKFPARELVEEINVKHGQDILLTFPDFSEKLSKLDQLEGELKDVIQERPEVKSYIKNTKLYFKKRFVENQISLLVLKLQAFLIFHEKYDLVYYVHEYNQPPDSDATFSNREPYPVFLNQILDWAEYESQIGISIFKSGFPGHHGITRYLKLTWLISILYAYRNRWRQYSENRDIIESFTKQLKNRDSYTHFKSFFEDLIKRFEFEKERSMLFKKFEDVILNNVGNLLQEVLKSVEKSEKEAKYQAKLNEESVDNIAKAVIDLYDSHKFYTRPEILPISQSDVETNEDLTFGVNQFQDREYFLENFEQKIYGLTDAYARELYETENLHITSILCRKLTKREDIKVNELNVILDEYSNEGHIIILNNLSLWRLLDTTVSEFKYNHEITDPYYAGEYLGNVIYSIRQFGEPSVMVLEKEKRGKIEVVQPPSWRENSFEFYNGVFYKIVDFRADEVETRAFLNEPPEWLIDDHPTEDGRRDFLDSKIWIRILKRLRYVNDEEVVGVRYKVLTEV